MTAPIARSRAVVNLLRDRFPGLGPRAYGLVVDGDGMKPRFASGDVLVIDPDKLPAPGDVVVLYDAAQIVEHDGGARPGMFHVIVGTAG